MAKRFILKIIDDTTGVVGPEIEIVKLNFWEKRGLMLLVIFFAIVACAVGYCNGSP